MAFAMIDDLTGEHHPPENAHRLALVLDPDGEHDGTIAVWDVASTDPKELLAQLGEHLSGVAAPLRPVGPLPGVESLRQALAGVRGQVADLDAKKVVVEVEAGTPKSVHEALCLAQAGLADRIWSGLDADRARSATEVLNALIRGVDLHRPIGANGKHGQQHTASCGCEGHRAAWSITVASVEDDNDDPDLVEPPTTVPAPRPTPRLSAPERVAEAVGGAAMDATIRLWAHQHKVPCSMTGKLNTWARAGYLRVKGGPPDQQLWDDCRAATKRNTKPSPSAPPTGDEPPAPDSVPPAEQAPADQTPEPAGRSSEETPAPDPSPPGRAPEVATDDERPRPEQLERAEELAADGRTPRQIVEATGVSLSLARSLYASAKGPRR